jgi:fatty-acyl-CoA synthase
MGSKLSLESCLEHWAHVRPKARAISDESESIDWFTLSDRVHSWAAALSGLGVTEGARVAVTAENSANLVVALFAIRMAGAVPLLLDPRCSSDWQAEILGESGANWLVYDALEDGERLAKKVLCRAVGFRELSLRSRSHSPEPGHRRRCVGHEPFVILTTSGTTGKPKQVAVSNTRSVLSGFGIAGLCLALTRNDAIHCVLPLSHATALMTALCPALVAGCALVVRRRFVPDTFWADVAAQCATHLLYVGELVRALVSAPSKQKENDHRVRVAYGNGLGLDVWNRFQARFGIRRIFEYYGATELPLALVNLAGEPGFIGRTPLSELSPWRIVTRDAETGELTRRANGTCMSCRTSESGELVLMNGFFSKNRIETNVADAGQHMRLVRDVVTLGDYGLRTGDIVRRDSNGYVRFEDRTFEIFRQQGHNVSTSQIVRALRGIEGIADVGVTHVTLPNTDGQLGLAVIVPASNFDIGSLARCYGRLAPFERPRFLRLTKALRLNPRYKFDHAFYRREGVNPEGTSEPVFVFKTGAFQPITLEVWAKLRLGEFRT